MQTAETLKLSDFIEASKAKGASDSFLADLLVHRGWPQADVYAALGKYWQRTTGLPIPERVTGGESARDAFLYLLSFSTLATWTSALGSMLFQFIEHWLPDPIAHHAFYSLRSAVTWQLASIAVAFPIFLGVIRAILREAQSHPERLESPVRKWLTYIALLLTAGAMICDLIWFFDYFLNGGLTSRFVLKAATVMVICGAIFAYYLGSLRWDRNTDVIRAKRRSLKYAIGATAAVVIAFIVGLGLAGTPSVQRRIEADGSRVENLRGIAYAVQSWHSHAITNHSSEPLPRSLSELAGKGVTALELSDPETKRPYEYRVQSDTAYQLCAVFSAADEPDEQHQSQFWNHRRGRTCFTVDVTENPLY